MCRFHRDRSTADIFADNVVTIFAIILSITWSWDESRTCAMCAKTRKMEKDGDEIFEQFWQTSVKHLDPRALCKQNFYNPMRAFFGTMEVTFCPDKARQRLVCGENIGEITTRFCFIKMDSFTTFT